MKHLLRITGLFAFIFLFFVAVDFSQAAPITNWTTHNEVQHRLDVNITPTQTTGIKIAQGQKNGADVNWLTTTGGTVRLRRGLGSTYSEDIYYRTATIGSDGVATLNGVIRNVCRSIPDRIQSCGDGQQFYAGDIVELTVDARIINWKLDKNRVNILTESGMITGTSTGNALIRFPPVTTAIRDAFTNVGNGDVIYNSTTGTLQQRLAGAWTDIGDASTPLATTTAAGKGYAANQAAISGATIPGYPTWIGVDMVIRHSSGAINNRNKVVATNNRGILSGTLLCTGTPAAGKYCDGAGNWVTAAAAGSGVGLYSASHTSDVTFTASTFTTIHANLEKTVSVNVGSILEMTFTGVCQDGSGVGGIFLDYQIGNGLVKNTASGSFGYSVIPDDDSQYSCNFTTHKISATGGSLVVRPMAKQLGATNKFFQGPMYSDIKVFR